MTALNLAGRRILLVEDEMVIACVIEEELIDLGCIVIGPIATLTEALDLAMSETIDAAILDVTVRGGNIYPVGRTSGTEDSVCPRQWLRGLVAPRKFARRASADKAIFVFGYPATIGSASPEIELTRLGYPRQHHCNGIVRVIPL